MSASRLYRWIADGSIFRHIAATLYATGMGFAHRLGRRRDPRRLARRVAVRQPLAQSVSQRAQRAAEGRARAAVRVVVRPRHRVEDRARRRAGAVSGVPQHVCGRARGRSGSDRRRAADARDAHAGHLQGDHPVGDVVGLRRPEDRDALCADRRRARRDDRGQSRARLSGAVLRLAVRFRRRIRGAVRDRAARGRASTIWWNVAQGRMERWRIVSR